MNLSNIFCQDRAVNTLTKAFETGKIPHAYIFDGIDGIGKFTTAKAFAKLLLCQSPKTEIASSFSIAKRDAGLLVMTDSCGQCESCKMLDADNHPDFHHIYKELVEFSSEPALRKKQPIDLPIDVIREFLINKIQIKPSLSASKVFVISEAEKLNAASQNALLKVLEEPPNKSFIILLCSKLDNLLPTTKSRSQIVHFGALSEEKIIEKLSESGVDKQQAKYLARLTCGSLGQVEILAKIEPSFYEIKKEFLSRFCRGPELGDCVDFAQWINSTASELAESLVKLRPKVSKADLGRQTKKVFVLALIAALADAMKLSFEKQEKITNFEQVQQVKLISQRFGQLGAADLIEDCFETILYIDASVNEKLVFEHLLLKSANYVILSH